MTQGVLVRSTTTGVRPLGVRGTPLHAAHAQIRAAIRRRLGERHALLLAEPESDETGRRIDWYAGVEGVVVALDALPPERREALRADIDTLFTDIVELGTRLEESPSDDARATGAALRLACRYPSEAWLFAVGDQPVVVCWGYEADATGAVLPPPDAAVVAAAAPVSTTAVPAAAIAAAATGWRPWPWLAGGLLAILLLLGGAWLLRPHGAIDPLAQVTHLPPQPAPPAPPAPPDPSIEMSKSLGEAQTDEAKLRATLVSLREEFATKRAACPPPPPPPKPPEPPVVEKKPDPPKPTPKPPVVAAKPPDPPPPPPRPADGLMRMPTQPTNDYSFLKGCWRGDSFRYTPRHSPGNHTYCFDGNGNGRLVFHWANGTTCTAPARARFQGDTLMIADADTTCSDNSRWSQDRLVCRRGADGVAQCSGETNLPAGGGGILGGLLGGSTTPTRFTVRLHQQ